jgi:hypothetical protein
MRPITTIVTAVAAVANGYALSQAGTAHLPLTLNGSLVTGGIGIPDVARRVGITSGGDDRGITFAVSGTLRNEQSNVAITETVTGTNGGTAQTVNDFLTVTSIVPSGNTAANVTAGTTATVSGPWVPWSRFQTNFQVSCIGKVTSGAPTWQVEYTYDNVLDPAVLDQSPYPTVLIHSVLQAKTGTADGFFTNPISASRLTLTVVGGVSLEQIQQGT